MLFVENVWVELYGTVGKEVTDENEAVTVVVVAVGEG